VPLVSRTNLQLSTDNQQPTTDQIRFAIENRPPSPNNPRMTDPRFKKLAKLLEEYSTALKKGERVLLDMIDVPDKFFHRADAGRTQCGRDAAH
jgi:hypothetical protein